MSPAPIPSDRPAESARAPIVFAAVALVLALVAFGATLGGSFLGDDFAYVGRFYHYPLARLYRLFVESWAGDMWEAPVRELRPITALSFILDARVWGGNAFGFRASNLLFHAACTAMAGWLAWRAANRDWLCGIAAAVFFALHPVHAEAVTWITGRVDVLATAFYLAGFVAFVRVREVARPGGVLLVGALYAAAAFSKEFGLTMPIMFLVADLAWLQTWRNWRRWQTWAPYAVCAAVAAGYFLCRSAALGAAESGTGWPDLSSGDFHEKFARRQLTYLAALLPSTERWLYEASPLMRDHPLRTLGAITAGVFAAAVGWRWGARWRQTEERAGAVFFGVGWYLVATLPLVVTYVSTRHLYLASAGLCIGVALLLRGLIRPRWAFALAALGLAWILAPRHDLAVRPWQQAGRISKEISRALAQLAPEITPGGALLLDVPELNDGAYVWTWAVPFALRPPFTARPLDQGVVVLESRGLFVDWGRWHEQPAVDALREVKGRSWIVQRLPEKPLRIIPVPPDRFPAAVARFKASPLTQFPHEGWRRLIDDLSAP